MSTTERPTGSGGTGSGAGASPLDKNEKHEAVDALAPVGGTESAQTMDPGARKSSQGDLVGRLGDAGFFRILGLVLVLAVIGVVGTVTAGDSFLSTDNFLTILRLSATLGVVAIGMTFVITGGGIDLSVGAVLALASIWATTVSSQQMAADTHWSLMVGTAVLVGAGAGLVNGVLIAYGKVVAFIATLAMLVAARGLAELMSDNRNQQIDPIELGGFFDFFRAKPLGVDMIIWVFLVVAVLGWVLLNRTTFGRRTFAVGGNPEAARLAGINVKRHTTLLYVLAGACAGLGAVLIMVRTTTGSSSHGELYELEAIAAVVIGGTLLAGGRGTIVGTVLGVIIFSTLTNVFVQNNRPPSEQDLLRGAIIVAAVLLQQWLAARKRTT